MTEDISPSNKNQSCSLCFQEANIITSARLINYSVLNGPVASRLLFCFSLLGSGRAEQDEKRHRWWKNAEGSVDKNDDLPLALQNTLSLLRSKGYANFQTIALTCLESEASLSS